MYKLFLTNETLSATTTQLTLLGGFKLEIGGEIRYESTSAALYRKYYYRPQLIQIKGVIFTRQNSGQVFQLFHMSSPQGGQHLN